MINTTQLQTLQSSEMDEQKSKPPATNKTIYAHAVIPKSISQLVQQLRKEVRWNLSSKKYSREHLEAVFNKLTRPTYLAFLWLHWNSIESICQLVVVPSYPTLKILNLGGNNIVSLQPLQHADMPMLEELCLWSNRLTRVDSLRKMYIPGLKYLDLSSNLIVECNKLSELHSMRLELISINNNLLGSIDQLMKTLLSSNNKKIVNFLDNDLVRVFGKSCKKGKKNGKNYYFPTQRVEYA